MLFKAILNSEVMCEIVLLNKNELGSVTYCSRCRDVLIIKIFIADANTIARDGVKAVLLFQPHIVWHQLR